MSNWRIENQTIWLGERGISATQDELKALKAFMETWEPPKPEYIDGAVYLVEYEEGSTEFLKWSKASDCFLDSDGMNSTVSLDILELVALPIGEPLQPGDKIERFDQLEEGQYYRVQYRENVAIDLCQLKGDELNVLNTKASLWIIDADNFDDFHRIELAEAPAPETPENYSIIKGKHLDLSALDPLKGNFTTYD